MSIVFTAPPVLLTATAVFVLWRILVWRHQGGDPVREGLVGLLFGWSLIVIRLTFFPLIIIFYDWYGTANLVPFASIWQLVTETPATVAFENIAGNVLLFVPFGFLLPLLFLRMRRVWGVAWRAALISVAIELLQVFTRARTIDVDDVILNTAGAIIGYGLFVAADRVASNSTGAQALIARMGRQNEPLLAGLVPVVTTLLLVLPFMISSIFSATLGGGPGDLAEDVASLWPDGVIVASEDLDRYRFVAVAAGSEPAVLGLVDYQRVLPGRFTRAAWGDIPAGGNVFNYRITAFNITRDELPVVVVWGSTDGTARTVRVTAPGYSEIFDLGTGPHLLFGFPYDIEGNSGLDELLVFEFTFLDATGTDVTAAYRAAYE
ncbi:MAG: VanZ family protein [Acidimicrobiia bacterium]|nr:VanZ family protein [Acidimicrobiia bacterium]MBT8217945.1 VanZ family protein [Acidimicrobiia bacterium]NNL70296.1 VanZ family protein [Acidimicrobiia bacterium]